MKPIFRSFSLFVRQIFRDSMLVAVCGASILTALFVRFGVPAAERLLCGYFGKAAILADYYLLFDLLLMLVTPYMLLFASAMMMLTEFDENLSSYLAVTPVGKSGYVMSRLLVPAAFSYAASVALTKGFSLTEWPWWTLLTGGMIACLASVAAALLMFSFSTNRVEGMAMGKLSGLLMMGLFAPFFLPGGAMYLFSLFPTFWLAKLCMSGGAWMLAPALLTSAAWLYPLYRRFDRKLA